LKGPHFGGGLSLCAMTGAVTCDVEVLGVQYPSLSDSNSSSLNTPAFLNSASLISSSALLRGGSFASRV